MNRPQLLCHSLIALALASSLLMADLNAESNQHTQVNAEQIERALLSALATNNMMALRKALQQGASANARFGGEEQETALIGAVKQGANEAIALLLAHNANPNATSISGKSPLLHAANQGNAAAVTMLVEHGANIDHQDLEDGATALLLAATNADRSMVRSLLDLKADPNLADHRRGNTPLITASARPTGYATVVALIGAGANVNTPAADGWTALIAAADQGIVDTVELLLLNGADTHAATEQGGTALQSAIENGFVHIVGLILQQRTQQSPATTLSSQLASGDTPLTLAVDGQQHRIIHQLLDMDADVNVMNARGLSPLMLAVTRGDDYVTSLLLGAGAKVNDTSPVTGNTALMLAANRDVPALVELLLVAGADPTTQALDGWTALEAAQMVGADASVALIQQALETKGH